MARPSAAKTCSNVTSNDCESPANLEPPVNLRTECFRCGEPVCKACSRKLRWWGVLRRICNRCEDDLDRGRPADEDGRGN